MNKSVVQPHKSSLGMDANLAVLIIYAVMGSVAWFGYVRFLAWVVPVVFFFLEKQSKFVKFHAIQALCIGVVQAVIALILSIIIWSTMPSGLNAVINSLAGISGTWVLLSTILTIITVAFSIFYCFMIYMGWIWTQVELPVIGPIAAKVSAKLDDFGAKQGWNNNPYQQGYNNPTQQGFNNQQQQYGQQPQYQPQPQYQQPVQPQPQYQQPVQPQPQYQQPVQPQPQYQQPVQPQPQYQQPVQPQPQYQQPVQPQPQYQQPVQPQPQPQPQQPGNETPENTTSQN